MFKLSSWILRNWSLNRAVYPRCVVHCAMRVTYYENFLVVSLWFYEPRTGKYKTMTPIKYERYINYVKLTVNLVACHPPCLRENLCKGFFKKYHIQWWHAPFNHGLLKTMFWLYRRNFSKVCCGYEQGSWPPQLHRSLAGQVTHKDSIWDDLTPSKSIFLTYWWACAPKFIKTHTLDFLLLTNTQIPMPMKISRFFKNKLLIWYIYQTQRAR